MLTYTYLEKGKFALIEKPKPVLLHERDAIVKVTLAAFVQVIYILNMEVFLVQCLVLLWVMKWLVL